MPSVLCVTSSKDVSHELSVLYMSVMGFPKCVWLEGLWMVGAPSSLLEVVWNCFNFATPLIQTFLITKMHYCIGQLGLLNGFGMRHFKGNIQMHVFFVYKQKELLRGRKTVVLYYMEGWRLVCQINVGSRSEVNVETRTTVR